jgi:CheY-like chemotaxis protein
LDQGDIILCVDDDSTVLNALRSVFAKHFGSELQVEFAESGDEALEIAAEIRGQGRELGLVITDFMMPGMKGDEFLVEAHRRFPTVVKIMLSGQAEQAAVDRARKDAGLHEFLAKPWNAAELVETINQGLREKL